MSEKQIRAEKQNFLIIRKPGCEPVAKGPWNDTDFEEAVYEAVELYDKSALMALTLTEFDEIWPESITNWLATNIP